MIEEAAVLVVGDGEQGPVQLAVLQELADDLAQELLPLMDAHRRVVVVAEQELRLDEDHPRKSLVAGVHGRQHDLELFYRAHVGDVQAIPVVEPDGPDVALVHAPRDALLVEQVEDRVVLEVPERRSSCLMLRRKGTLPCRLASRFG